MPENNILTRWVRWATIPVEPYGNECVRQIIGEKTAEAEKRDMAEAGNKKKLVSFDLDMTLLDHADMRIPDSALEAIEALRESCILALASGRNMDSEAGLPYQKLLRPDAIIHMNGTRITVGEREIYHHRFEEGLLLRLLSWAADRGCCLGASIDGYDYVTAPEKAEAHDKKIWGNSERRFRDPFTIPKEKVHTLWFFGDMEDAFEMGRQFPQIKVLPFSNYFGADIVEQEASKGEGLKRLCEYYGIPLENTYAFGDSMNDVDIVRTAGTGIAMGNAIQELKEAADYVTDSIDRDGVAKACRHFGLI